MYYWCTTEDRGEIARLNRGGHYEKIDETGWPVKHPGGFAKSDVPEVCMSKSPEACLFAIAHNVDDAVPLHVYRTPTDPDIDLSDKPWDFSVLEEVRYRNLQERELTAEYITTVELPQRAFDDASEAYNPYGPYQDAPEPDLWDGTPVFYAEWAEAVKDALRGTMHGEDYPEEIEVESEYADWPESTE